MNTPSISKGNQAFREKDYATAIHHYIEAQKNHPSIAKLLNNNIALAKQRLTQNLHTTSIKDNITKESFEILLENESTIIEDLRKYSLNDLIKIVQDSGLFEKDWYLGEYRDVANNPKVNPISHFTRNGGREKRNPGPGFQTAWYLTNYPDAAESGINPLIHYLRIGKHKNYQPFDKNLELVTWWANLVENREDFRFDAHRAIQRLTVNQTPVAIIIPVYNALKELKICINSVLRNTNHSVRIILVNDASPDPEVLPYLNSLRGTKTIEIHHNDVNLGFSATVNKGMQIAGTTDVVFLNSDACVTPNWLVNLRLAAYSGDRVATATPFSNNAGAYSAPIAGKENFIPETYSLEDWARAINQTAQRIYAKAPTGHGFCMYIRHDCIEEIGGLDHEAFPRGYGEENDFCMRALAKGWHHIVDQSTYIYHARSASFGSSKTELLKQGRAVIDRRYPHYTAAVRSFLKQDDFVKSHEQILNLQKLVQNKRITVRPRILYVLSTKTGGTPQTNQDLMQALSPNFETFVLYSNAKKIDLVHYEDGVYRQLSTHTLDGKIEVFPHRLDEYDNIIANWLVEYSFEIIHIRHLAWHSVGIIDTARTLGLPIVLSFHDFYTVCPTVKLLDNEQKYCGGKCTESVGNCKYDLWHGSDLPELKNAAIFNWRKIYEPLLMKCDAFVTTSQYAKEVIIDNYNLLTAKKFVVIPHGRNFSKFLLKKNTSITSQTRIKLLIPGNITQAKGGSIIFSLAKKSDELNIEIHILGKVAGDVNTSNCILHGEYNRNDFIQKVDSIDPHIGCIFSIWPETHCHTLTELWAAGVPVFGFDIGAVGERIRQTGAGWLTSDFTAQSVENFINDVRSMPDQLIEKTLKVAEWQNADAKRESCEYMASQYLNLYRTLTNNISPLPLNYIK